MTDQPDFSSVFNEVSRLAGAYKGDPMYEIGPDGMPMSSTQETSPAQQALLDAGYTTTPGQAYSSYDLAPQGTYERDLGLQSQMQQAMANYQLAGDAATKASQAARNASAVSDAWQPGGAMDAINAQKRQATVDAGFPSIDNRSTAEKAAGGIGGFFRGLGETVLDVASVPANSIQFGAANAANLFRGPEDQIDARWQRLDYPDLVGQAGSALYDEMDTGKSMTASERASKKRAGGRSAADVVGMATMRGVDQQRAAANKRAASDTARAGFQAAQKKKSAKGEMTAASDSDFAAQRQNAIREAYARALLAQGRSPFDDERNRRNASTMGY